MKPKKVARIKGHIVPVLAAVKNADGLTTHWKEVPKYLELPIDNPDALVEQVRQAIVKEWNNDGSCLHLARAALCSIGVPIKREIKK